jgi:hypothetical protein
MSFMHSAISAYMRFRSETAAFAEKPRFHLTSLHRFSRMAGQRRGALNAHVNFGFLPCATVRRA